MYNNYIYLSRDSYSQVGREHIIVFEFNFFNIQPYT